MKLFIKHLFNSVKNRPLQPIILIFTLMLATVVCTATISIGEYLDKESVLTQSVKYGNADISVELNSSTQSRFMFTDDVREILGDDVLVAGAYELPLFYGDDKAIFAVATDFFEINDIFNLEFIEYGDINNNTKNDTILISYALAKRENLTIGSNIKLDVLGYSKDFIVQGISKTPYIASYDAMLDINGVMGLLAQDSLFVSSLGDNFKPCNTLYIDINDSDNVSDAMRALEESKAFSDKTITSLIGKIAGDSNLSVLSLVIYVMIVLTAVLCSAVVFCCFYILSSERSQENAVFNAVGAKIWRLNLLSFIEIICYWVIGFVLGFICSLPMANLISYFVDFKFVTPYFSVLAVIKSGGMLLIVSLLTTLLFVLTGKQQRSRKKIKVPYISLLFGIFAILFALTYIVPASWQFVVSCLCGAVYLIFIFCFVPILFKRLAEKIDTIFSYRAKKRAKVRAPSFTYAIKNVSNIKVLQNTCRLAVLLVTILFSIVIVISSAEFSVDTGKSIFNGDYAVLTASDSCKEKLLQKDDIEGVYSVFYKSGRHVNDVVLQVISYSDIDAIGFDVDIPSLPVGNEAIVPLGHAQMLGLNVGDKLFVSVGDENLSLVVKDIIEVSQNTIIVDITYFDIPYNMIVVNGREGVSQTQLKQSVTNAIALELTTIISIDELIEQKFSVFNIYLSSGGIIIPFAVFFALIGIIDNLLESYRARKEEFSLYKSSGMSKCTIRRMKLFEVLTVALFAFVIGVLSLTVFIFILDRCMVSYGYKLLLYFTQFI